MLIEGKLPTYAYANHAQNVTSYFKSKRYNDENVTSVHLWIDTIDAPLHVRNSIKALRDAPVIIDKIQESYPGYRIVPEKNCDEVYLSVDPLKRRNSDVVLSACHYDAPFKYVPQCGNLPQPPLEDPAPPGLEGLPSDGAEGLALLVDHAQACAAMP
eukprot:gene20632-27427_t